MSLKQWQNKDEIIWGNDLNSNFSALAAGTEIGAGAIYRSMIAAEAWSDFTPTPLGFSGSPTVNTARWIQYGKTADGYADIQGTSNTTTFKFTLPFTPKFSARIPARVTDAGTTPTAPGYADIAAGSTAVSVYKDLQSTGWSTTGTKRVEFGFVLEVQ